LSYAMRIGVRTGGLDTIDRFSTLIVDGQPCPIAALSRIKGSPPATPAK
jgi:hypothetical protein